MVLSFHIKFNRQNFHDESDLRWKLSWNDSIRSTRRMLVYAISLLIVAYVFFALQTFLWIIAFAFGLHYLLTFIYYFRHEKKSKKSYNERIEKFIDEFENAKEDQLWEFGEEDFHYRDHRMDMKINWQTYKGYEIISDYIVLHFKYTTRNDSFFISKTDLGDENYARVKSFIEEKLPAIRTDS